ncbi:protein UL79 [macacine betaherpesvirus 9]|uniref:Protein UL79 n=1 Tax=macacine betaherpesvirus 9 TaxID=2560568 RepID=A0A192XP80_9BETA|nr:protein UL79 [macacine betaherpesvirus 9]ANC96577.1 protein UL79 [macacine betaherpesvirus 9]
MQVGQYLNMNITTSNLILHITKKLVGGEPLFMFKQEEILVVQNVCTLMFSHGIKILLLRETLHNVGVSDLIILNRKISNEFWFKIYQILKDKSGSHILSKIFDEEDAAYISKQLHYSGVVKQIIEFFFYDEFGISISFPKEIIHDGNILFSTGALYNHRFLRICRYFNKFWGESVYEPFIRKMCKHLWFAYLVFYDKLKVSEHAFKQQRPEHGNGFLSFIQSDFKIFCGIVEKESQRSKCSFSDLFVDEHFQINI